MDVRCLFYHLIVNVILIIVLLFHLSIIQCNGIIYYFYLAIYIVSYQILVLPNKIIM